MIRFAPGDTITPEHWKDTFRLADQAGEQANKALTEAIDYLATYACGGEDKDKTECYLAKDFAPHSFVFTMRVRKAPGQPYEYWFNGGLIYSGPGLDGDPVVLNGGAPAFTVSLEPTGHEHRWSVHT